MSGKERPGLFAASALTPPFGFDGDPIGDRPNAATLCGRLAVFLRARPNQWIDGRELATIAGAYGWRTRVSDLRRPPYSLTIENRQRRHKRHVISEYRFVTIPEGAA